VIPQLHIIDFEGHPRYGVVEYGVVTVNEQGIVSCATGLCAPTGEIPPADTRVHGIDAVSSAGRAPFSELYAEFVEWRRSGLFVAHNAHVEHGLLKSTWSFPPYVPAWGGAAGAETADWGPWLDTLVLARELRNTAEDSCSLEALSYGGELRGAVEALAQEHCPPDRRRPHCALYDALATCVWLRERVGYAEALTWFQRQQATAQGELF
jgi:DNA polymerase-3 subunit epsilon|tara:strand:+ start:95101 stop:95727 length:627 start_codon:yes stop_codon:yes gene_type:complete